MAYDVLASTAILLFPRLFSVLDHYRYFSQLLIAFRMMAQDLLAVLILIMISCSGFFVAFTLSFSDDKTDGNGVAYILFQILMGFTPAAWDHWAGYNILGKAIMAAFLIICHFVIVTILITVLTNSFMAIVKNAHEEHQFLFAVNPISMVKSDALFSYIPPTNVAGWMLTPLRYVMPFRQFVKLNRTIIKVSHFPILIVILGYERLILSRDTYGPTDMMEKPPRPQGQPVAFTVHQAQDVFSPGRRLLREPSIISFSKDKALDEVFRRPFRGSTIRTTPREMEIDPRKSKTSIDKWMQAADIEGGASPPLEQSRSVVERLENRRPPFRRAATADKIARMSRRSREFSSDPDIMSTIASRRPFRIDEETELMLRSDETLPQETDADGDDENNPESDIIAPAIGESALSTIEKGNKTPQHDSEEEEYFQTPMASKSPLLQMSAAAKARLQESPYSMDGAGTPLSKVSQKKFTHARQTSTGTILWVPQALAADDSSSTNAFRPLRPSPPKQTKSGTVTPAPVNLASGQRTPKFKPLRARPIMPPRQNTAPGSAGVGMSFLETAKASKRHPSFNARALDLASDIGDNKWGPAGGIDAGGISGMTNSFGEELFRETELQRRRKEERRRNQEEEEKGMVNRIMLARMNTLEEGFREVLREIKDLSRSAGTSLRMDSEVGGSPNFSAEEGGKRPRKRISNEAKGKRSPKKRSSKGKETVRPDAPDGATQVGASTMSEKKDRTGDSEERPGTAVRSPQQSA